MKQITFYLTFLWLMSCGVQQSQQEQPIYKDTSKSIDERVADLISKMTLEEKVSQMRYDSPAIEHLGIPAYNWWNECLHGVGRAGEATVFPQAIGMAAMWDAPFMNQIATAISDEARAKHNYFTHLGQRGIYQGLTFWTPNINIFRDPRWGRGQETYGEDPYLTSRLAVNFIKGLQGDDPNYLKVVATAKHFAVHSGPEKTRHSDNYQTSNKDLWETYLPAFEATVKEAHVASLMCAYNRYRDEVCCGSHLLLDSILRKQWNFDGYVVSDCWAIEDFYAEGHHEVVADRKEASALAVKNGTDLNCGNSFFPGLVDAVEAGILPEEEIDKALTRLMRAKMQLGMFNPELDVPYNKIPYAVVRSEQHLNLSLDAARKSLVLLKNENNTLPLSKDLKRIAVIGPTGNDEQVLLGNYHGTATKYFTPYQAIKNKLPNARVTYDMGSELATGFPMLEPIPAAYLSSEGKKGLKGEYFKSKDWTGKPAKVQQDSIINFKWTLKTPVSGVMADTFSVKWSGDLTVPETATYRVGLKAGNFGRLTIDDSTYFEFENVHHPLKQYVDLDLEAGKSYKINIDYFNFLTDPQVSLQWAKLGNDYLSSATKSARDAEVVVLCLGLSPDIEGEEMPVALDGFDKGDRSKLTLPEPQLKLMQQIKALNKPTILVLLNGSAVAVNWADENVPAILEAWYPGELGGKAIADVLFGDYNPSGKLPLTFYKSVDDLPAFNNYEMAGRTYEYFKGDVLYPFGHGLSYTSFVYNNLKIPEKVKPDQSITVSVDVTNTGSIDGEEVVQLYVSGKDAGKQSAIRSLQGFARVMLKAGETKQVNFQLNPKQYAEIKQDGSYMIEPGSITVTVGGKQPGFEGNADAATTQTIEGIIEIEGEAVKLAMK